MTKNKDQNSNLESEKLVQEIKALKKDAQYALWSIIMTFLLSGFGLWRSYVKDTVEYNQDQFAMFHNIRKQYYELIQKHGKGTYLEEEYILAYSMRQLSFTDTGAMKAHIDTLYSGAYQRFKDRQTFLVQLDHSIEEKSATDSTNRTQDTKVESSTSAIDSLQNEIKKEIKAANTNDERIDSLFREIQGHQSVEQDFENEKNDSLKESMKQFDHNVIESIKIKKQLYDKPLSSESITLLKEEVHWFKKGYYVTFDYGNDEYAVWLDEFDKKAETIQISLWKRNENGLLVIIPNSSREVHKGQRCDWNDQSYKIEFQFLRVENAGRSRTKAAYFGIRMSALKEMGMINR
ncbi:hypothetical protein KFE98_17675 [bacterium SCSIO 12741]|nr:hypothetical protein KFE98_17675 [bacterium SCSIO 12741]